MLYYCSYSVYASVVPSSRRSGSRLASLTRLRLCSLAVRIFISSIWLAYIALVSKADLIQRRIGQWLQSVNFRYMGHAYVSKGLTPVHLSAHESHLSRSGAHSCLVRATQNSYMYVSYGNRFCH